MIINSLFIVNSFIINIFTKNIISDVIQIDIQLFEDKIIIIIIILINFIINFICIINKRFYSFLLYQSNPFI